MTRKRWVLCVGLAIVALSVVSCAGTGEFPTGTFDSGGDHRIAFRPNGTYTVLERDGTIFVNGTYDVEGDEFTVKETEFNPCAPYAPPRYQWLFDGEKLEFEVIEDKCDPRREDLTSHEWTLQP